MMSVYSRNLFSFFLTEGVGVRCNRSEKCWGRALFEGLTAGERAREKLGPRPPRPNVGFLLSAVSSPHCLHSVPWARVLTIEKRSPWQLNLQWQLPKSCCCWTLTLMVGPRVLPVNIKLLTHQHPTRPRWDHDG